MIHRRSQILRIAAVAATLATGGCATTVEEAKPLEQVEETPIASPAPASSAVPIQVPAFDAEGNPYVPGTTRLLARSFYFDYDRSVLKPDSLAALERHAEALREHSERVVVVEGHADERGTREYNLALGERRAKAVRDFLLAAGVAPQQIQTVSYGEERPEIDGNGEGAWSQNRRAFLEYAGAQASTPSLVGTR
jgi:peptidoglycan-associated lipoprotein